MSEGKGKKIGERGMGRNKERGEGRRINVTREEKMWERKGKKKGEGKHKEGRGEQRYGGRNKRRRGWGNDRCY